MDLANQVKSKQNASLQDEYSKLPSRHQNMFFNFLLYVSAFNKVAKIFFRLWEKKTCLECYPKGRPISVIGGWQFHICHTDITSFN